MHITSGLSPASGEMLDTTALNFYGDAGDQCGVTYFAVDHAVPESSHTVEIEYVYEQPETYSQHEITTDLNLPQIETVAKVAKDQQDGSKTIKTKHKLEKPVVEDTETDLTNLTWLQNITNIMSVPQFPIPPMSPSPPAKPVQPQNTRLQKFNQTIAKCQKDFTENKQEYKTNSEKKPPYSYSTLICMAMRYNNDKMTLSAIYSWIRENFKYYRNADPTWQVSYLPNRSVVSRDTPSDLINGESAY